MVNVYSGAGPIPKTGPLPNNKGLRYNDPFPAGGTWKPHKNFIHMYMHISHMYIYKHGGRRRGNCIVPSVCWRGLFSLRRQQIDRWTVMACRAYRLPSSCAEHSLQSERAGHVHLLSCMPWHLRTVPDYMYILSHLEVNHGKAMLHV